MSKKDKRRSTKSYSTKGKEIQIIKDRVNLYVKKPYLKEFHYFNEFFKVIKLLPEGRERMLEILLLNKFDYNVQKDLLETSYITFDDFYEKYAVAEGTYTGEFILYMLLNFSDLLEFKQL